MNHPLRTIDEWAVLRIAIMRRCSERSVPLGPSLEESLFIRDARRRRFTDG